MSATIASPDVGCTCMTNLVVKSSLESVCPEPEIRQQTSMTSERARHLSQRVSGYETTLSGKFHTFVPIAEWTVFFVVL
jgi:hypothetical protein